MTMTWRICIRTCIRSNIPTGSLTMRKGTITGNITAIMRRDITAGNITIMRKDFTSGNITTIMRRDITTIMRKGTITGNITIITEETWQRSKKSSAPVR